MDLVFAFYGAILQGAIPAIMPFLTEKLSPEQYRKSLTSLFEITAPAAVITYPEFKTEVHQALPVNSTVRIVLDSSLVSHDGEISQATFENGLQRSPEDIVLLQHSSGTTGLQKGVALSHSAVFNQLDSYSKALKLNQSDVIVSWLPLYHDMGLIAGFILPILSNIPLVLLSPFDWVRAPTNCSKLLPITREHYPGCQTSPLISAHRKSANAIWKGSISPHGAPLAIVQSRCIGRATRFSSSASKDMV
jgi:acyl-CoA synthetase (AMP-forming)/AMP-acid ligase II